jgi:hypothetical protein
MKQNKTSRPPTKVKRGKGYKQQVNYQSHLNWVFPGSLQNEAAVLHSILGDYDIEFYSRIVFDVKQLITQLVRDHGFTDGPKRYHVIKNYTIALIERRDPENPGWLATSKVHRVPSKLNKNFIKLIVDYLVCTDEVKLPKYYQVINTILNIVRMVKGLSAPEFDSVTGKAQAIDNKLLSDFEAYVSLKLNPYKYDRPKVNLWKTRFHLNRNGPNKVPKIESAIREASCLLKGKLRHPFSRICDEMNCSYLVDYLEALVPEDLATEEKSNTTHESTLLRKLVKVPDRGFKTRIVAIADFWTQLILEPVRDHVQSVTKRLFSKTDFRLDQDRGIAAMVDFQRRCMQEETIPGTNRKLSVKHLKFYDISSWTDRFHRDLQKVTMRQLFSPRLAEAWAQLVVHCDWYSPDLGRTIKYGQGQGMGTNGSFDVATLTDHLFINFIYDKVSQCKDLYPNNECYGKVGDDLWVYDPEDLIKEYYAKIHLPINLSKSKEYVAPNSVAEFCARTFLNGTDVSRISPAIISKSKNFRYIPILLALCSQRGIQLECSSFENLQRKLHNSEETYLDKLQDWIISFLTLKVTEPGSMFSALTADYLEAGGWIKSDRLKTFMTDQLQATRLKICHSLMQIAKARADLKDTINQIVFATEDRDAELTVLCNSQANLFDPANFATEVALSASDVTLPVLTPKQIIVLGRYVDQRKAILFDLNEIEEEAYFIDEPEQILEFASNLEAIARRASYDAGNINYDAKRVVDTQWQIVNTLAMGNEDLTEFTLNNLSELKSILQEMQYDDLYEEWEELLPMLKVKEGPVGPPS